jgi:hypothetical protein
MKPWYLSTLVWIGGILAAPEFYDLAIMVLEYFAGVDWAGGDVNWLVLIAGVLIVIRRWLTDTPISSPVPFLDDLPGRRQVMTRYRREMSAEAALIRQEFGKQ